MEEIKTSFSGVDKIIEEYKKPMYLVSFIEINDMKNTHIWNSKLLFDEKDCFRFIMDILEKAVWMVFDHYDYEMCWFNEPGPAFDYFEFDIGKKKAIYRKEYINIEIIDHIILNLNSAHRAVKRQYYYNINKV